MITNSNSNVGILVVYSEYQNIRQLLNSMSKVGSLISDNRVAINLSTEFFTKKSFIALDDGVIPDESHISSFLIFGKKKCKNDVSAHKGFYYCIHLDD